MDRLFIADTPRKRPSLETDSFPEPQPAQDRYHAHKRHRTEPHFSEITSPSEQFGGPPALLPLNEIGTQTEQSEIEKQLEFYRHHLERVCKLYSHPQIHYRPARPAKQSPVDEDQENKPLRKSSLEKYTRGKPIR